MNFNMKKHIFNIIIVLIILFAILFVYFIKNDFNSIIDIIGDMQLKFVFLAILLLLLSFTLEGVILFILLNRNGQKYSLFSSILLVFSGQFFNGITPFSSGGQPFQIYYLSKKKFSTSRVTLTLLASFIIFQTSVFTYSIISISTRYSFLRTHIPNLFFVILTALLINLIVPVFVFSLSKFPKFRYFIIHKVIYGLSCIFFLRFLRKFIPNIEKFIDNFTREIEIFIKNKLLILSAFALSLLRLGLFFLIPMILFLSLGYYDIVSEYWYEMIIGAAIVNMVSSAVPLPGGTGGAELMFITVFSKAFGFDNLTATSVSIVWRGITYYFALLLGAVSFFTITRKRFLKPIEAHSDAENTIDNVKINDNVLC